MLHTISRFVLVTFISISCVQSFANTAVPVSDLVNNTTSPSLISAQPGLVQRNTEVLGLGTVKANANAQMFDLVELLQKELQQLRGQVEELNYNLTRLKQDQKQLYLDLDRRIVSLSAPSPVTNVAQPIAVANAIIPVASTTTQQVKSNSTQQDVQSQESYDPAEEKAAYKVAFALIRERQYDAAIVSLLAFVKDYPKGDLLGNAHYWLGEVYMVQGDASLAARSFEYVIAEFPQHRKIPDALYKAGVAYQNVGDVDQARLLLQRVLNEYPDSSAARLATERVN